MKPGKHDRKYKILINGLQLEELQRFTWSMAEAFGLDGRIERYKGTRPISFYAWDLDCLDCVISQAVEDPKEYPDHSSLGYLAMKELQQRILDLRVEGD